MAVRLTKWLKGFKKCRISNTVDGTDDDILLSGNEEDGNVRSECEENVGIDCEGGESDTDW